MTPLSCPPLQTLLQATPSKLWYGSDTSLDSLSCTGRWKNSQYSSSRDVLHVSERQAMLRAGLHANVELGGNCQVPLGLVTAHARIFNATRICERRHGLSVMCILCVSRCLCLSMRCPGCLCHRRRPRSPWAPALSLTASPRQLLSPLAISTSSPSRPTLCASRAPGELGMHLLFGPVIIEVVDLCTGRQVCRKSL